MKKISLIINTLNEEEYIASCINSAKSIVDEIIVCDMNSDDNTVSIAKSLGAKVVFHERTGFVEPARYFAISQASHEWVLVLDADEQLTDKLACELRKIVQTDSADLVSFSFLYNYFGKYIRHGGFFLTNLSRFFKKKSYIETYSKEEESVHHNFANLQNYTKRQISLSKDYYVIHDAYPTFEKFLRKTLCNYALIDSQGRFSKGDNVGFIKVCLAPVKEFFMRYVIWQGFRDGKIGFLLCYLRAQYTFYIYINLWFLNKQKK